jgi:ABC-2 type transport system permease protein
MKTQLRTVLVFTKLSTRRFFRDRLAQFFTILFPLIFLFVFGSFSSGNNNVSFKIALINQSSTAFARNLDNQLHHNKTFKIDNSTTLAAAKDKMSNRLVTVQQPFRVNGRELNEKSLTSFDYTFAGLLGFSIIGLGIFGPVNVFPELKKQGVLRRLHTTPLKTWQYFMSTMFSTSLTGFISIAIQFLVAIKVFHLKVNGDYPEIIIFTIFSIFMILGLGLAIGGWAKNERQAAPLSNIVVFPMLFLSGTFFPRFLMPHALQTITNFLPLTPVIDGLRLLITEGKHLTDLGPQLGLMAVWFVVIYGVAFRVFRWE